MAGNQEEQEERKHGSTVELHDPSALEILEDAQEILTKMIQPSRHAEPTTKVWHEQTKSALNLVLKAITILKREETRKRRAKQQVDTPDGPQ